jgi:hypothetical protein
MKNDILHNIGGLIDKINTLKVQLEDQLSDLEDWELENNEDSFHSDEYEAVRAYLDYIDIAEEQLFPVKLPNCSICE